MDIPLPIIGIGAGLVLLFLVIFFPKRGDHEDDFYEEEAEEWEEEEKKQKQDSPAAAEAAPAHKNGRGWKAWAVTAVLALIIIVIALLFLTGEIAVVSSQQNQEGPALTAPPNLLLYIILAMLGGWALWGVTIVPQGYQLVTTFLGKHFKTWNPGVAWYPRLLGGKLPLVSLKDRQIDLPAVDDAETRDNVTVQIDGRLWIRVINAGEFTFNVEDGDASVQALVAALLRGVVSSYTEAGITSGATIRRVERVVEKTANDLLAQKAWGCEVAVILDDISRTKRIRDAREDLQAARILVKSEQKKGEAYASRVIAQAAADRDAAQMVETALGEGAYLELRRLEALKDAAASGNLVVWPVGQEIANPALAAILKKLQGD